MQPWSDEKVWDAVDAWRWRPPSSERVVTDEYELMVTPGSYSLTYVYGLRAPEGRTARDVLHELRSRVVALGGTGARVQLTPRSGSEALRPQLEREGFVLHNEAEVLVWELRDEQDRPRVPSFQRPEGVEVREVLSDDEYAAYRVVNEAVFRDPPLDAAAAAAFSEEFHRRLRTTAHSDRYLARVSGAAVGLGGMEVSGAAARFFGSGVVEAYRHRGIYGELVRARCEAAAGRGAEITLVTALLGTSGPILKRHGFRAVGPVRVYEAQW